MWRIIASLIIWTVFMAVFGWTWGNGILFTGSIILGNTLGWVVERVIDDNDDDDDDGEAEEVLPMTT